MTGFTAERTADWLAIADKLYKYCRSVDRLDVALGHSVFHADSYAVFPTYQGPGRGWIDAVCLAHRDFLHHSHQVTNIVIDFHGAERAGSEAYVTAKLRQRVEGKLLEREFCARYIDAWSKRDGDWAIERRECIVDFDSVREVTPIGDNPRGRRDRSDPSYEVLKGLT